MSELHLYLGYSIPAGFALLFLWTIYTFIRNRPPHDWFWNLLGLLQVVIGLQVLIGAVLFAANRRPPAQDLQWLHYLYGGLFPAILLVAAHRIARLERFRQIPWAVFGFASFINAGLTTRALMTGLGTG